MSDVICCYYYVWEWKLDGLLFCIFSYWDFVSFNRGNVLLCEVKVDIWGGFIFINVDEVVFFLFEVFGLLLEYFVDYGLEDRYIVVYFWKLVLVNWKLI